MYFCSVGYPRQLDFVCPIISGRDLSLAFRTVKNLGSRMWARALMISSCCTIEGHVCGKITVHMYFLCTVARPGENLHRASQPLSLAITSVLLIDGYELFFVLVGMCSLG